MLKLSNILTETTRRSQKIRKPIFMNALVRGQFSSAYNKMLEGRRIYRGITGSAEWPYWIVKPGSAERKSRNTSNFYTGLIDNLPSWKNYPKRSRSIICSTGRGGAASFGNVLDVFPKNGAKIGICSAEDFWLSFPATHTRLDLQDMSYFNAYFISIFYQASHKLSHLASELTDKTYPAFIKLANELINKEKYIETINIQRSVDRLPYGVSSDMLVKDVRFNFNNDWEKYFDELLNPEINGFVITTIEDYQIPTDSASDIEIWTDAPSLMISHHHQQELFSSDLAARPGGTI